MRREGWDNSYANQFIKGWGGGWEAMKHLAADGYHTITNLITSCDGDFKIKQWNLSESLCIWLVFLVIHNWVFEKEPLVERGGN